MGLPAGGSGAPGQIPQKSYSGFDQIRLFRVLDALLERRGDLPAARSRYRKLPSPRAEEVTEDSYCRGHSPLRKRMEIHFQNERTHIQVSHLVP
jgi:hypothetical protein